MIEIAGPASGNLPGPCRVEMRHEPAAAVRAIVAEAESAVSHASIVAREYGLPMIVNVPHATQQLVDGTRVTVDGGEGWIRIEAAPGGHRSAGQVIWPGPADQ